MAAIRAGIYADARLRVDAGGHNFLFCLQLGTDASLGKNGHRRRVDPCRFCCGYKSENERFYLQNHVVCPVWACGRVLGYIRAGLSDHG